jgi:hypothetical protein
MRVSNGGGKPWHKTTFNGTKRIRSAIFLNGLQRSVNRKVQGSNPWSGAKSEVENRVLVGIASTAG